MYHVYDSNTLLGKWNAKEDSSKNKTSYDAKVLELAKANYAKYYNKEKKDVTTKEIEDSSAGVEGWGEPMEFETVDEELGPAELAKDVAQNEEEDEELVDTDEEIVAGESDNEAANEEEVGEEEDEEEEVDEEEVDEEEVDEEEVDEEDEDVDEDDEEEDEEDEDVDEDDEEDEAEEEVDEDDEEDEAEDDDEELEVEEIKIEGKMYYCTGKENGVLFEYCEDGEIGEEIGHLEDGAVFFS